MIQKLLSTFFKTKKQNNENHFFKRRIENVYHRHYKNTNLKYNQAFDIGENFVFYFDMDSNSESNQYIRANYTTFKEQFNNKGREFFYIPLLIENRDKYIYPLLKECFPHFSDLSLIAINENLKHNLVGEQNFIDEFFDFINYTGEIKKGCVSSNCGFTIVEQNDNETIDQFLNDYIKHLPTNSNDQYRFYSLDKKLLKSVQKETIESYDLIKSTLEKLRNNGELLLIAPRLYKLLETNLQGIKFEGIAPLTITKDYKILISNNSNLEIKLSHLTKTVFIFFLIQTEEVEIKDLQKHQKELLKIYTSVSNQLSLAKLKDSIQELVNPNNDLIYTHFSRIKSEIQNHFEPHVAHQYFINGDKGMPKKINLSKDKISFEQPFL